MLCPVLAEGLFLFPLRRAPLTAYTEANVASRAVWQTHYELRRLPHAIAKNPSLSALTTPLPLWRGWWRELEGGGGLGWWYRGSSKLIEAYRRFSLLAITATDENWLAHHKLTRGSQREALFRHTAHREEKEKKKKKNKTSRTRWCTYTSALLFFFFFFFKRPHNYVREMTSFKCSTSLSWQADWFFFVVFFRVFISPAPALRFIISTHLQEHLWGSINVRRVR